MYSCFIVNLLQPAAVLSQAFQADDVDAVTVSTAFSTVKKHLDSLQHKEVHRLQTVRHYLDKVENEEYQGVKLSGFTNALAHLSNNAKSYVHLLNNALEARLGGSSEIASVAKRASLSQDTLQDILRIQTEGPQWRSMTPPQLSCSGIRQRGDGQTKSPEESTIQDHPNMLQRKTLLKTSVHQKNTKILSSGVKRKIWLN